MWTARCCTRCACPSANLLHVGDGSREPELRPGLLRSYRERHAPSGRGKSATLAGQVLQDGRSEGGASILRPLRRSGLRFPWPPPGRSRPESRSVFPDRPVPAPNRSASPGVCLWPCLLLSRDSHLEIGMDLVGRIALAGLQHAFSGRLGIGKKSGSMLRRRGGPLDGVDHECMRGHPVLLCGRNGALLELVGKFQGCGGHTGPLWSGGQVVLLR
jgi:hypothetical protein